MIPVVEICVTLFVRAFLQCLPVACSTVFIARGRYVLAGLSAFCISFLWFTNAGTAGTLAGHESSLLFSGVYGFGAMAGALCGMALARHLSK
jgi:hypothetical protein